MADGFFQVTTEDQITPRVNSLVGGLAGTMQKLVEETSFALTPFVQQRAPVGRHFDFHGNLTEGGQLRDSLRFVVGQWGSYLSGAEQGRFVITGTVAHQITPRSKRALAFYWERAGQSVVRKSVQHPGSEANDFRQKALQQAFDENVIFDISTRAIEGWVSGNG